MSKCSCFYFSFHQFWKYVLYCTTMSPFLSEILLFFRRLILITWFTLIPVQLKLMMLANVPSNPKLARYGVKFFLILENTDSSSTLLWMMHNIILASLKRLSNLLLLVPGILSLERQYHRTSIQQVILLRSASVRIAASSKTSFDKSPNVMDSRNSCLIH